MDESNSRHVVKYQSSASNEAICAQEVPELGNKLLISHVIESVLLSSVTNPVRSSLVSKPILYVFKELIIWGPRIPIS